MFLLWLSLCSSREDQLQQGTSKHHTECTCLWEQSERMKVKCSIDFPAPGTSLEIRNKLQPPEQEEPRWEQLSTSAGVQGVQIPTASGKQ